jgi:hypothetical protein
MIQFLQLAQVGFQVPQKYLVLHHQVVLRFSGTGSASDGNELTPWYVKRKRFKNLNGRITE